MDETDSLPHQICSGCEQELKTAYNFRVRCDESYKAFQKMVTREAQEQEEEEVEVRVEVKIEEVESTALTPRMKYKRKLAGVKDEEYTDVDDLIEEGDNQDDEDYVMEEMESGEEEVVLEEQNENDKPVKKKGQIKVSPEMTAALATIKAETNFTYDAINDVENKQKYYQCKVCEKRFTRQTHVKRHMMTHSNIKPYKCGHCDKCFSRSDHLQKHNVLHMATRAYTCELCPNRVFSRPESLKNHMKRHTAEPKAKNFMCEKCKRTFSSQKYLDSHVHSHNTPKTFSCKFCPEIFEERKDLQVHNKIHINERPFLCSECGQRFLRNDYLVIHMRRHKGEKPYKCKFCEKCFPRATDLTVHERYHTDAKTHLCTTCGKGFHRAYNLLVHMRVHTGKQLLIFPINLVVIIKKGGSIRFHIKLYEIPVPATF